MVCSPPAELGVCLERAPGLVRSTIGYADPDLVQDARESMLRAIGTYQPERGSFRSWAMMRARWDVLKKFASQRRLASLQEVEYRDEYREPLTPQALVEPDTVDETDERIDMATLIANGLAELGDRDRQVVVGVLDGELMADVGARFGVTVGRVSQIFTGFTNRYRSYKEAC